MEEYFRSLIKRCNNGQLSANDMLKRVEHSDFVSPTAALKKAKKALPPKQKKIKQKPSILVQEDLPSSLTSLSTKATEQELARSLNTCSLTTLEDNNSVAPEKSIYEKQADLRQNLVMQSAEGLDLQKFIEVQLRQITEKLGPINDKEQLEDIKRKCRLKWMLRMKQIQRERVRKEEEDFKAHCSFQPKTNDSDVNSRYMDPPPPSFRSMERSVSPDFSFTPRINKKSISILRSSTKYNKADRRESSVESNRGSVQNQSVHFKSVQSEGPLLTNRFKSNTRASIVSGPQAIDEDFSDLMQNLNSVRPCPKEQSPKMFIEDLRQPQQEENRVEKVLDFNDDNYSVQNSNKKQSLGLYRNYLTQMTETTTRNLTIPSARSNNQAKPRVAVPETAKKPKTMIRSESLNKSLCKDNSRFRGSVNNKENLNSCKKNHGGTESATKAFSKEERNKWFEGFFNRTQQYREDKSKRLDQVTQDANKDSSFQPKISKNPNNVSTNTTVDSSSTANSKWSYEEKVNKFLKGKEEWLAKRREEKAAKELEGVTHQPTINKKVAASSKLNTNLPTGLYIEKLKEQEQNEKEYVDLMKRRQLMLETAECTYRPQINENPFQLRKILSPQSSKVLTSSLSSSVNNGGSSSYKTLHTKKIQQNVTVGLSQRANTKLFYNNHQKEHRETVPGLFDGITLTTDNNEYYYGF